MKYYFVKAQIADQYTVYDVLFTVKRSQKEAFDFMVSYNKKVEAWKKSNEVLLKKRGKLFGKLYGNMSTHQRWDLSKEVNEIDVQIEESLKKKKSIQKVFNISAGCIVPFKFNLYDSKAYIQKFNDSSPMELE